MNSRIEIILQVERKLGELLQNVAYPKRMKKYYFILLIGMLFACTQQSEPENVREYDGVEQFHLYIPDNSLATLDTFIERSKENGIISAAEKKYVNAYIKEGDKIHKAKIRLKGDWIDHLETDKVSYRIKLSGESRYKGLKSFSIQHPKTRKYIDEWVIHQMAEDEGLLSTKYDFVQVVINNENKGVYALEEHFDKQLLESRNRREGPILKLDEQGAWSATLKNQNRDSVRSYPYFQSSFVSLFKKNRTRKSPTLSKNFAEGKKLVELFRNGYKQLEHIFDIDALAKYYALMEIAGYNHGLRWHNRRFYYNPVTQQLEHIIYDVQPFTDYKPEFHLKLKAGHPTWSEFVFDNAIFLHQAFLDRFEYHLERMTSEDYLNEFFKQNKIKLDAFEQAIQQDEPEFVFNQERYFQHASFLRDELVNFREMVALGVGNRTEMKQWIADPPFVMPTDGDFIKDISVNAYLNMIDSTRYELVLENYHLAEVSLLGVQLDSGSKFVQKFEQPIILDGYLHAAKQDTFYFDYPVKKIGFVPQNNPDAVMIKKVIPWSRPSGITSRMALMEQQDHHQYKIVNGEAVFAGRVLIEELISIPSQYPVRMAAGSTIQFKNGGGLIVNNDFYCDGKENLPVNIVCTDSLSQGVTVLNGDTVRISDTKITGLSNLNYGNWELTGALTIYEAKQVKIDGLEIKNNLSEDALNIIRSDFDIVDLRIENTTSDGFDADFCTGILDNSYFGNTGNDCIDFSGSQVLITNVQIENSGDKGISGGERSHLMLSEIMIANSYTGIASKDESFVEGERIVIDHAEFGFLAFQKKGEYGPAEIFLNQVQMDSVISKLLIDMDSKVTLDGQVNVGNVEIDVDSLYLRFQ